MSNFQITSPLLMPQLASYVAAYGTHYRKPDHPLAACQCLLSIWLLIERGGNEGRVHAAGSWLH